LHVKKTITIPTYNQLENNIHILPNITVSEHIGLKTPVMKP